MMIRPAALMGLALVLLPVVAVGGDDFFETRIRPVLHEQCVQCHGPEKQQGRLRVDALRFLLEGGDSGAAVVPGRPDDSLLLRAMRHVDVDLQMPPSKAGPKLSESVLADFSQWIEAGAAWPTEAAPARADATGGTAATVAFSLEERKNQLPWIWVPPQRQTPPELKDGGAAGEIDRFILAALETKGLASAPPVDDAGWLRRVSFALIGLPPGREELHAFLADVTEERRERVVDRLLASPHFGERWARHWMDVMRYAESRGHESDFIIANAWRYRDYLIRAYNADVPYDQFVAEHVAGDLRPPRLDPATGANQSVVATGWAFLGEENHSPVDIRQDECERLDNKVDVFSKAFLALTISCARCHDHKFDAITQNDYYALAGFVVSSSFRQVRFETMEAEARVAKEWVEVRERGAGQLTAALAAAVRPGVGQVAAHLMAARRVLRGGAVEGVAAETGLEVGRVREWVEHLTLATTVADHPLRWLAVLAADPAADEPAGGAGRPVRLSGEDVTFPATAAIFADFTKPGATPWQVDGVAFGDHPLAAGEMMFGTPERPIARFLHSGAAVRDPFWNRLTLAPGTETDSGSLGATARAGQTLRTPKVTLRSGRLHYLIRGRAQVYAGVDSHLMIAGPLHGSLVASFDTGGRTAWVTHDLTAYAGHRAHLEFAPQGEAALEVLMAVDAAEVPGWRPLDAWRPDRPEATWSELAAMLQADCAEVTEALALASGSPALTPRQAVLADWLLQNPGLTGTSLQPLTAAAVDFFRERDALAASLRWDSATAVAWADGAGVDENVLLRGKPSRPGAVAPRRLPEAFGFPAITPGDTSGRAELAGQMIDPANPLVARVMVNRVWHHLFGRGLVATVDNFGVLGERPSHPELLDHLAWQFVHEDGWSLKRLMRRLVLTRTFAQSSRGADERAAVVDPANLWWHRMPVRRLEGEAIRDALLVVAGRLNPVVGGASVPVHLTEFIVGRGRPETSGPLDGGGRRSLYLAARRNFLPTMMLAFDLPTPFSTVGRRNVTNVPAQSLVMMNDPLVAELAGAWAARLLRELPGAGVDERVDWLFETGLGRPPEAEEAQAVAESLAALQELHVGAAEDRVWGELCHALVTANDFIYLQ